MSGSINSGALNTRVLDGEGPGAPAGSAGYFSLLAFWIGGAGSPSFTLMAADLSETDTLGLVIPLIATLNETDTLAAAITLASALGETDTVSATMIDYGAGPMVASISETDTISAALLGQMMVTFGEFDLLSGQLSGGFTGGMLPLWRRRKR